MKTEISIHAPREGGDSLFFVSLLSARIFQSTPPARGATHHLLVYGELNLISIHAPREGGRHHFRRGGKSGGEFQSTPPARGATARKLDTQAVPYISIHAPREGGDIRATPLVMTFSISIHAPREGGDTTHQLLAVRVDIISIHAPREGGDSKDAQFYLWIFDK